MLVASPCFQNAFHLCLSYFQVMNLNDHFLKKNLLRQFWHRTLPKFRKIYSPAISDINGDHITVSWAGD